MYNVTRSAALEGTLTAQSSGASTTLKGSLTGTIVNGDKLKLKFLSPNYSTQDGTLTGHETSIDKVCDYAEAVVTVTDSSTSSVTTTDAEFENQQAIVKFTLMDKADGETPVRATLLAFEADGSTYTVTPASATEELFVAVPAIIDKTVTLFATDGTNSYSYEKTGVTFTDGQYYTINVKMTNTTNYLTVPLTFEAKTANCTVMFKQEGSYGPSLTVNNVEYNVYDSNGWQTYNLGDNITLTNIGDKVSFRGTNGRYGMENVYYSNFSCSADCYIYGNIMSLISEDGYPTATELDTDNDFTFWGLFHNNTHIVNHPSKTLVLPATTLADYCYCHMFAGCTSLTTAPELPATMLATGCYYGMFNGCSNLSSVTCLATDISATNCTNNWLSVVKSTGTFTKAASMSSWTTDASGISSGWTVNNY